MNRSGQTKDYEIGMCCFSAKQEKKQWLVVSESGYCVEVGRHVYPRIVFQWASTIKIQLSTYQFHSLWFDPIGTRNHDLPHSRRAPNPFDSKYSLAFVVFNCYLFLCCVCRSTKGVGPVQSDLIIIPLKINLFSPWYSWKIDELALNNHSLTKGFDCYAKCMSQ
jgi:hypothetical protein